MSITYRHNPNLKTILPDWKGNPIVNGRFVDPHKRFNGSFKKVLQWKLGGNEKATEKKNDTWKLPVIRGNGFLKSDKNKLVWLGHASFFLQLNDTRILIDPVFGSLTPIVPRLSALPCAPEEFTDINYVLLSHAHRDHADKFSLREIFSQNSNATLLTSLNTGKLVAGWVSDLKFQEAGWYQQYNLSEKNLRITFLPVQHWSNRYLTDINHTLYGSFMIEADGLNIFFNGDSGYCSYPKHIAELYPNIDIALIGIGAYHPPMMMKDVHTNPEEAVQIFNDLKAKTLVPMHYGTFDLADEPLGEPLRWIKKLESEKKINGTLRALQPGESLVLG